LRTRCPVKTQTRRRPYPSIYFARIKISANKWRDKRTKNRTHERDTVRLALGQRARKDGKVDRENRKDGHEHHIRAIRAERGQARGLWLASGGGRGRCAPSATVVAMETRGVQRGGRCVGRGRAATGRERRARLVWGEEEVEERGRQK
jgi:hypothetical protein